MNNTKRQECYNCHKKFRAWIPLILVQKNFCHQTEQWYCDNCMAAKRSIIPLKFILKSDIRSYPVSKKAFDQIQKRRQTSSVQNSKTFWKKNSQLPQIRTLKKKIQLMFDLICNTQQLLRLLKGKSLRLRANLFRLYNQDTNNIRQINELKNFYKSLLQHFCKCQICQEKRCQTCRVCLGPIFSFQVDQTNYCKNCEKLYHSKCCKRRNLSSRMTVISDSEHSLPCFSLHA